MLYEINLVDLMSQTDVSVDTLEEGIIVSRATASPIWENVCQPGDVVGYIAPVAPGVFEVPGFNFEIELMGLKAKVKRHHYFNLVADASNPASPEEILYLKELERIMAEKEEGDLSEPRQYPAYGVCDDYRQVLALFPELRTSERLFVMSVTSIRKDREPDRDGWRWHKWGPYIGTQRPQTEYIADEPEIERVYVYHVYELEV